MAIVLQNNSKASLGTALGIGTMTFDTGLGEGSLFAACTASDHMWLTVTTLASYGTDVEVSEIIRVSPRAGDTFTVTARGQEGTTERAFAPGDIVEQRVTRQTLIDMGGAGAEKPRSYIDEFYFTIVNSSIPTDGNILRSFNTKYASNLLSKWDAYWGPRIKIQLEDMTRNIITDGLSFPTLDSMVTWINANTTNTAGAADQTIVARPYETIDETIPVVTKLYGLNRFYSALRGKRRYTSSMGATAKNASAHEGVMASTFNRILGTSLTAGTIDMDAVWLGRSKKNHYTEPKVRSQNNVRIDMREGSQDRTVWDTGLVAFKGASAVIYENSSSLLGNARYVALSNDMSSSESWEIAGNFLQIPKSLREGYSIIMVQGIENGTEQAIYIKPLGIDQVVLPMPDFSIYDFEMVFFNHRRQGYINVQEFSDLGDFNNSNLDYADADGAKLRLSSAEWFNASDNNKMGLIGESGMTNDFNWDTVRFRLRNKVTGEVSNLSYAGIVTESNPKKVAMKKMAIKSFHDMG